MSGALNPLLAEWPSPLGLPPFDLLKAEHFRPAFDAEMAAQLAAIDKITADKASATFANTILPLELSVLGLDRVAAVFFHLASADTNDALEAVEREISPLLGVFAGEHCGGVSSVGLGANNAC